MKAAYPGIKVIVNAPVVRSSGSVLNGKFAETSLYALANMKALGIDICVDTRQIPALDCRTPKVTTSRLYDQGDGTHRTPLGYTIINPLPRVAYDYLCGVPIPSQHASMVIVAS